MTTRTQSNWVVKAVVTTAITLALGGAVAWAAKLSSTSHDHETRITVNTTQIGDVKDDIKEIKDGQKEMNQKLDRLIEREAERPRTTMRSSPRLYGR